MKVQLKKKNNEHMKAHELKKRKKEKEKHSHVAKQ
jgi:hypothetical protein